LQTVSRPVESSAAMGESAHVLQLVELARGLLSRHEEGWEEFLAEHGSFEVDVSPEKSRELAAKPRERQQHEVRMLFPAEKRPALRRLQALPDELKKVFKTIFDRMTEDEKDRTQVRSVAIESATALGNLVFLAAVPTDGAGLGHAELREKIKSERRNAFAREMAAAREALDAIQVAIESRVAIPGPDQHVVEAETVVTPEGPEPTREETPAENTAEPASRSMADIMAEIKKIAPTGHPLLFVGERGTGKTYLAQRAHKLSERTGEFRHVSCPAVADPLFESEMFGHVEGAFSDAKQNKTGHIEAAAGGTVFLDEIGDVQAGTQAKLLQVLQEGTYYRVGDKEQKTATCRFILATNRDLAAMIRDGKFREDLYDRVSVFTFRVPPLRERREEIPALVKLFQERHQPKKGERRVTVAERRKLRDADFDWPGNVRMLENAVIRAFERARTRTVTAEEILAAARESMP